MQNFDREWLFEFYCPFCGKKHPIEMKGFHPFTKAATQLPNGFDIKIECCERPGMFGKMNRIMLCAIWSVHIQGFTCDLQFEMKGIVE